MKLSELKLWAKKRGWKQDHRITYCTKFNKGKKSLTVSSGHLTIYSGGHQRREAAMRNVQVSYGRLISVLVEA